MPRQDEPLAEQQFKNIQSFKGEKASDVIPAMEFMSASLGVGCDYCHTEDRSSDAKGAKLRAREMIAMQRDINTRNFRGRNQVTCASCHAGHTHPVSVPPVEGAQVRARRSDDVQPEAVLAAYGRAVGGDPATVLSGLRLVGNDTAHGERGKVEAAYAGQKFLVVTHGAKTESKVGFTGTTAWFDSTARGVQRVPLVYAIQYLRQYTLFAGPDTLPRLLNPSGATAKVGDRDMVAITGLIEGSQTRATLFFDKKTNLLARTVFGYPSVLGTLMQTNDYTDYRKVGGIFLPMTVVNHTSDGDTTTKFTSAKLDGKIDSTTFEPPQ